MKAVQQYRKNQNKEYYLNKPTCFAKDRIFKTEKNYEVIKTNYYIFALCLNIDSNTANPLNLRPEMRHECWLDPNEFTKKITLRKIGINLKNQYFSPRRKKKGDNVKVKICLDPSSNKLLKLCDSLRNSRVVGDGKNRILFHYNGHGVPSPSDNGEIWFFDEKLTLYVPVSIFSIHRALSTPTIYVFDCGNTRSLIRWYKKLIAAEKVKEGGVIVLGPSMGRTCVPQIPHFPLDFFTSCLTTPLRIAIKFWEVNNKESGLIRYLPGEEYCGKGVIGGLYNIIPGKINDCRTELGHFNLILKTICDVIAWEKFDDKKRFKKYFRDDEVVANLMRNFFLAERILRAYGHNPVSFPFIPSACKHPLWQVWDRTLDLYFSRYEEEKRKNTIIEGMSRIKFFEEQMDTMGLINSISDVSSFLPVVHHIIVNVASLRIKAIDLLVKLIRKDKKYINLSVKLKSLYFVNKLGQWLITQRDPNLENSLVKLYSEIIIVDNSFCVELFKYKIYYLIVSMISYKDVCIDTKIRSCLLLVYMVKENEEMKKEIIRQTKLLDHLKKQFENKEERKDSRFLIWLCVVFNAIYDKSVEFVEMAMSMEINKILFELLRHRNSEVRSAAVYGLNGLINEKMSDDEMIQFIRNVNFMCRTEKTYLVIREILYFMITITENYVKKIKNENSLSEEEEEEGEENEKTRNERNNSNNSNNGNESAVQEILKKRKEKKEKEKKENKEKEENFKILKERYQNKESRVQSPRKKKKNLGKLSTSLNLRGRNSHSSSNLFKFLEEKIVISRPTSPPPFYFGTSNNNETAKRKKKKKSTINPRASFNQFKRKIKLSFSVSGNKEKNSYNTRPNTVFPGIGSKIIPTNLNLFTSITKLLLFLSEGQYDEITRPAKKMFNIIQGHVEEFKINGCFFYWCCNRFGFNPSK